MITTPEKTRSRPACETILDAVDGLLPRYGYQKMTMEDIAREAGVSKRTIYLNFTNKQEVALSSIDRVVRGLIAELSAIAHGADSHDARLRRMLVTRVLYRFDHMPGYYQSFDDLYAAIRPAYMSRRRDCFDMEAQLLAEVLEDGRKEGALAVEDSLETANTLLLATNSLLPFSLSVLELGTREELERKVAGIADVILDGLRTRSCTNRAQ